jgi:hypothetical protein
VNLYFLVEGDMTEKLVYRAWLRHALPALSEVSRAEDLRERNYFLVSGAGYPSYLARIRSSLLDIRDNPAVDHFFICIDSEEMTFEGKLAEVRAEVDASEKETGVSASKRGFRTHVIVQHCCMETWFLGNGKMMPAVPEADPLKQYAVFYDVRVQDPEGMGCHAGFSTRARFHLAYLKEMVRARGGHLRYTKAKPGPVTERQYYDALLARAEREHIASFAVFARLLRELADESSRA